MPTLLLTLGEALSVNIELIVRCRAELEAMPYAIQIIGHRKLWEEDLRLLGALDLKDRWDFIPVVAEIDALDASRLELSARGSIAVAALERAAAIASSRREATAVITMPIDKRACALAGFAFPGQTEFFAARWHSSEIMILAGPKLRVGLATNHVPLREVATLLSPQLITQKICLLARSLQRDFGIANPRIAVAALNPHAGDNGLFGKEDQTVIAPGIKAAIAILGLEVAGPLPADTVFFHCLNGSYDAVLALYHDQGLGPLKTVHFYDAINLTGGLPHFRASPDHGPAADLRGRNKARPDSLQACLRAARCYLQQNRG